MIPLTRILLASGIAPLAVAVPIGLSAFFAWSYAINDISNPDLRSITPVTFALQFTVPLYGGLVVGFLATSWLLQITGRLNLKALLITSGAISLLAGAAVGGGAFAYAAPWEAVLNVLVMSLVVVALLAVVSASWWRLAGSK